MSFESRHRLQRSDDGFYNLVRPLPIESPGSIALFALLLFAGLSLLGAIASQGFLEADGCTHYLYARYAFQDSAYLFNVWGRPVCTFLYAIGAQVDGRFGVRCVSLLTAVGIAIAARRMAQAERDRIPWLATICLLAQPLLFLHSFSELTELPFALLLGLAFVAFQARRWMWLAIFTSLLPMTRPEGFPVFLFVAVALSIRRQWVSLALLPLSLIAWNYLGWHANGSPAGYRWWSWLVHNWPYAQQSAYERKSILVFVGVLPAITSPLLFPGLLVGIWRSATSLYRSRDNWRHHRWHCEAVILLLPLAVLVGHSLLTATGRMASNGEPRYMLVVAPFWAVLTARGISWIFERQRWSYACVITCALALSPMVVNRSYVVIPLNYADDWLAAERATDWLKQTPFRGQYPLLAACHPGIYYFSEYNPTDASRIVPWNRDRLLHSPKGTILVWDWVYGTHNSNRDLIITLEELERAGWVRIGVPRVQLSVPTNREQWVLLSPFDKNGRATDANRAPFRHSK